MKVCIAQTKSKKGDIQYNIVNHKKLIQLATSYNADIIIFPELSLTAYEPTLAKALAININDNRLDDFQVISNKKQIVIGLGAPTKIGSHVAISMIIFQPQKPRQTYSKKYLHRDEEAFFVSGNSAIRSLGLRQNIALAICYELSVPEHAEEAYKQGAEIYLVSAAKTVKGVEQAIPRLSEIASKYSIMAFMSNCVGEFDGCESGGKSSIWNNQGMLVGQLDHENEGLLIFDTESHKLITKIFK